MRILKLPKTTPVGSLIYRLRASAAQDLQLKFVIANGTDVNLITIKSVDFYQANVYLNKQLQLDEYNFTIYVTDGIDRTLVDCQIVVKNSSQLMTSSFIHFKPLLSVPESASFNSTIGFIHVKEKDNSNLPVTFEIEGSDCFGVQYIFGPKGTSKAKIFLKTQLDYEKQNLFRLQVYALNAWTNETFDTRNIVMRDLIITVINEQDTPPIFKQMPHLVQLTELSEPGDILLTLNAIDGDHEQNRIIKYYLRQDDELYNHFVVDPNTGEVVLKSTIDKLREIVGHENLFTLTFVAKEEEQKSTLTARKIDSNELDHIIGNLNAESDFPIGLDTHDHYIVNDHFYDENIDNLNDNNNNLNKPISSSLTSDLLAIDSNKIDYKSINNNNHLNKFNKRSDSEQKLPSIQSINSLILNRKPLKSTPINIPPFNSNLLFKKRMLNLNESINNNLLLPKLFNLTTIELATESNRAINYAIRSTTTPKPSIKFFLTTKPLEVKATTFKPLNLQKSSIYTTPKSIITTQLTSTIEQSSSKIKPKLLKNSTIPSILIDQTNQNLIKNKSNFRYVNLVNEDNLVADEHFIVNNLTSIGLMDENFKPENLIEPESSAENSRMNSERASIMNTLLNELSSSSKTETEINIGFIILQISNNQPKFPLLKPNFTINNEPYYIMNGQIDDDSKPNTLVQLENELLIVDQDHGLNGTFDVQLIDSTNTFDIQPKTGYRNQTFQIQLINLNQLHLMENKKINLKIIVTDRSPSKSLKNELIITVHILDTNNNFPQFTQNIFKAKFYENDLNQIGKSIIKISATDIDSGEFGKITYSHLLGDLQNNLNLNSITGEITLISLENIDREKRDQYTLIIYVCDNGCKFEESNLNQTLLIVDILDFNDQKPEFPVTKYDFLLTTDLFSFSSPIQVEAFDSDEPNTPNSNVTYEIISGNFQNKFKINKLTGEIDLISPLMIQGTEKLPILDLENTLSEDENENDLNTAADKNRLIDYPWSEDSFDLGHLDDLFSYFSPVINLTIRAHDQGHPIQDNFINVYIHCQNYLNRTVVFIVNESESIVKRKKQEYERHLSEMASGRVRIMTIQETAIQKNLPNRTLLYSTVTYPSQSVINVNKVNWHSAKILDAPPNLLNVPGGWSWFNLTGINRQGRNQLDTNSVKTAGLDNNSFITWLLIMIILITLIFLLILIAIWCYFCGCRKRKNKINSADSTNYYSHHLKQMNKQLLKHQQLENDSIDSQTDVKQLIINNHKQRLSASSQQHGDINSKFYDTNNEQMNEFDAAAFQNKFKKRIKPGSAQFENAGYISDADPSGNFILTTRKPRSAPDISQKNIKSSTYIDDTGVFTSNKINYDDPQNSPSVAHEDAYSILNRVWFGDRYTKKSMPNQQQLNQQNDQLNQKEETNDLYATVKRSKVKFTDVKKNLDDENSSGGEDLSIRRLSQDETSVKQLQDKHRTASQLTLRSQLDQIDTTASDSLDQQVLDQNDSVSRLPKAILKNTFTDQKQRSANVSPSSDTDSGIGQQKQKDMLRKNSKEIIKSNNVEENEQKPPTPPPLPLTPSHHITQKLHLKNEDVAKSKSVFTIAYNEVKTDRLNSRLNSADSSTIYI